MLYIHKDQITNFKNGEGPDPFNINNKLYYVVMSVTPYNFSNNTTGLIIEYRHVTDQELYIRTLKHFESAFTPLHKGE